MLVGRVGSKVGVVKSSGEWLGRMQSRGVEYIGVVGHASE